MKKNQKLRCLFIQSIKNISLKRVDFIKKSIIKLDASLSGVLFELDNFSSFLNGSIQLDNSSNLFYNNYNIYSSKDNMLNSSNTITLYFDDVEGLKTEFSRLLYKGVQVGKVTNIYLTSKNRVGVKIQIFKEFDKFAKKRNDFLSK